MGTRCIWGLAVAQGTGVQASAHAAMGVQGGQVQRLPQHVPACSWPGKLAWLHHSSRIDQRDGTDLLGEHGGQITPLAPCQYLFGAGEVDLQVVRKGQVVLLGRENREASNPDSSSRLPAWAAATPHHAAEVRNTPCPDPVATGEGNESLPSSTWPPAKPVGQLLGRED